MSRTIDKLLLQFDQTITDNNVPELFRIDKQSAKERMKLFLEITLQCQIQEINDCICIPLNVRKTYNKNKTSALHKLLHNIVIKYNSSKIFYNCLATCCNTMLKNKNESFFWKTSRDFFLNYPNSKKYFERLLFRVTYGKNVNFDLTEELEKLPPCFLVIYDYLENYFHLCFKNNLTHLEESISSLPKIEIDEKNNNIFINDLIDDSEYEIFLTEKQQEYSEMLNNNTNNNDDNKNIDETNIAYDTIKKSMNEENSDNLNINYSQNNNDNDNDYTFIENCDNDDILKDLFTINSKMKNTETKEDEEMIKEDEEMIKKDEEMIKKDEEMIKKDEEMIKKDEEMIKEDEEEMIKKDEEEMIKKDEEMIKKDEEEENKKDEEENKKDEEEENKKDEEEENKKDEEEENKKDEDEKRLKDWNNILESINEIELEDKTKLFEERNYKECFFDNHDNVFIKKRRLR
ncbi:hypothetical protein LbFV_ORF108 [Leptopilina boulardi filamentous virus]|uniref:Uncharacterized protein n=1 Tax=Leptopilina boulardi filamentous virus TaxID=552509 RepID=A0A1S5YDE4_9VIRU|nr:hypothetical protein LbFV_ORF108 [Leptopilina boulardi filamentous virus]AQQ80028.1 hypothetical protein LbFV_ORF108 [Leptopilina boulardi filamentous virus]